MNGTSRSLAAVAFAILCFATLDSSRAQEFEKERAAAVADMLPKLEKVAKWCNSKGLAGERDGLYEALLIWKPDHRRARSLLKYRKKKGQGWVQSPRYKRPKNRSEAALMDLIARREAELGPFRDRIMKALEAAGDRLPFRVREQALREVVALHPMNEAARAALGETFEVGEWVLVETVLSRKRRRETRRWAAEAMAAVPPAEPVPITDKERALGVPWIAGLRSARVRVFSTVDKSEILQVYRLVEAHWPFLEKSLGARPWFPKGFRIMTLADKNQAATLFAKHPEATAQQRSLVPRVGGMWIGYSLVEYSAEGAERRIDGSLRQALGASLKYHYGIGSKQAWVWEGFGLHATWLISGTRLTSFVKPGAYDEAGTDWKNLDKPTTDWLFEAEKLLTSPKKPSLHTVLNRRINDLTVPELLYGYALSVYLFEGRPKEFTELLTLIGTQKLAPEKAVEQALKTDLPGLERRVIRWLRETAF